VSRLEDLRWEVGKQGGAFSGWILANPVNNADIDFWRRDFELGDCGRTEKAVLAQRIAAALNYVRGMTTEEIEVAIQAKFAVGVRGED
jgi:hypothetical protein